MTRATEPVRAARRPRHLAHVIDLDDGTERHVEGAGELRAEVMKGPRVVLHPGDRVYLDGCGGIRLLKGASRRAGTYRGLWWVRRAG